jgi:putative ABC transport system substrate-binding protein
MKRRDFLSASGVTSASWLIGSSAPPATAQTPNRIYRLGHLANTADSETFTRQIALPELARLGFVEGRNLVFDGRVGQLDALPRLMGELLAAKPDAIVAVGPAMVAAGKATRSVPIVTFGFDPIELGFAASYAKPGGNVTGVVILVSELEVKRLSILLEAVPGRKRIAVLLPTNGFGGNETALQKAAEQLGVKLLVFAVAPSGDYRGAFATMQAQGAQALLIGATPQFQADGKQLADLALQARLPTVCEWPDMARAGCLIGYGPSRTALRKRMAAQIAQIFRGVAPGDIPIERPTALELALNLGVARSLGLNIPAALLATAGEVIE